MPSRRQLCRAAGVLIFAALACAGDPGRQVEKRRAGYTATLSGFLLRDEPGRERPRVVLDVLVAGTAKPPLPGLTIDVSMADARGREKARRRVHVDSSRIDAGGAQLALELDDLPYEPGDGFWVGVRGAVPPAERGEYPEFGAPR